MVWLSVVRHGRSFELKECQTLPAEEERWWQALEDHVLERFRRELESEIPRDDVTIERSVGWPIPPEREDGG
jgi:hypothetical protein